MPEISVRHMLYAFLGRESLLDEEGDTEIDSAIVHTWINGMASGLEMLANSPNNTTESIGNLLYSVDRMRAELEEIYKELMSGHTSSIN